MPASARSTALGKAVAFELPSNAGALVPIPQPGAAVTLLDAFAPTCKPCAKKVPALLSRQAELSEAGVKLVLVAVLDEDESIDDAMAALRAWGAEAPFLVDRGDVMRRELAVDALPASVVLDRSGTVRWVASVETEADEVVAAARSVAASR